MEVLDGAEVIRDKLLEKEVLDPERIKIGPVRPPNKRKGGDIPVNCLFINDQGGLPGEPYLNDEGKQSTPYYDLFIRNREVGPGRQLCKDIQSAIDQEDYEPPITTVLYVSKFLYSGRGRDDTHVWRAPYKVVMQEYR